MTFAVIFGWIEQKYSYVPGLSNLNENLSSVSSAFDLNTSVVLTTVCGISSLFTHIMVVPAATMMSCGMKLKLSILTTTSRDFAAPWADAALATKRALLALVQPNTPNIAAATINFEIFLMSSLQTWPSRACYSWSVESTTAKVCLPRTKFTFVRPSNPRSLSVGTFIGPGEGAVPGCGCGNAVDIAVWKVTLPSTFCIT